MHGEERPFVITGQYEQVFPMDIYPVQLLKAVLIEDIELMEELGIYEVVEEDFALCEFVCTSKIEAQDIIRRGLDIVRKEMGA
jgi:Na+-transporting NADH:ubiquinone oxidoreductase subunit A